MSPQLPAAVLRPYAPDDAADRGAAARRGPADARAGGADRRTATRLIEAIRAKAGGLGGVEDMLREYALSTKEGLALMVLAEALLRVPDAATADRLIEDKLGQGDFAHHETKSERLPRLASAWALGIIGAHHPAGRDAGGHPRAGSPSASACRRCARRRGRPCG